MQWTVVPRREVLASGKSFQRPLYKVSEGFRFWVFLRAVQAIKMATKTHYKVSHKIEAFYAGGAVSLASNGELLACAYYDEVKVAA